MLATVYALAQQVDLAGKTGRVGVRCGLRGAYVCEDCDPVLRRERGWCPFLPESERGPGVRMHVIDSAGDAAHDEIEICPRAVEIGNPGARHAWGIFSRIEAAGSARDWYGDPLSSLPSRVGDTLVLCREIVARFAAQVARTRREMDR